MIHITTGAEATGGMVFGLSDELPVLQNLMCNGSEYSLSYCPGYDLNNVSGEHCLSGDYQAGVRCIQGKNMTLISIKNLITFFCIQFVMMETFVLVMRHMELHLMVIAFMVAELRSVRMECMVPYVTLAGIEKQHRLFVTI